jgi:hypothetical protein
LRKTVIQGFAAKENSFAGVKIDLVPVVSFQESRAGGNHQTQDKHLDSKCWRAMKAFAQAV